MRNRVGRKNRNTSLALHEREFWTRMAHVLPEQHRQVRLTSGEGLAVKYRRWTGSTLWDDR